MKIKETETLELKKSTSELKEAVVSIAAILNKHCHGEIYFGIKNDGAVIGQQVSDSTLREISRSVGEQIEPKIYPKIKLEIIDNKSCVLVEFEGEDIPYFAYGRAYIRVGTENHQLSPRHLGKLINKEDRFRSGWESKVSELGTKQVNTKSIKEFVKRANDAGRLDYHYDNTRNILNKLDLLKGDKLLNAAQVLFCDKNTVEVQSAVFAGNDKITFLDIQRFTGNLFELINKSENYIKEHINWRADLSGSRRKEIPEIPIRAISESIINSLCHRDFANPKGNEIAIFKNRIEIYNPGRFPENYSPKDFIRGKERSILRNPLIANAFYLTSDIERWGSGLKRIYDACTEAGIRFEFEKIKSGFLVIFYRPDIKQMQGVGKGGQKRWVEGWVEKLVENQKKILNLVKENPYISKKELSEKIGIGPTAIDKNISTLKRKGLLKRVGPDKGGHWLVHRLVRRLVHRSIGEGGSFSEGGSNSEGEEVVEK